MKVSNPVEPQNHGPIEGSGVLKLDLNERSDSPPSWLDACEAPREAIWRYTSRQPLETSIAARFDLAPEQVLVTNGGDEALCLVAAVRSFSELILPKPCFGLYESIGEQTGLPIREIAPNDQLGLNIAGLTKTLHDQRNALVMMARPNNPTGELIGTAQLIDLLETCHRQEHLLLLDEAYAEFAGEAAVSLLARFHNLLILRTFSKAYGLAGLRVGYLLGNGETLAQVRAATLPYNVSSLSLYYAQQALLLGAEDVDTYCEKVAHHRDQLHKFLCDRGIPVAESEANFLLLPLTTTRAQFVFNVLKRLGIWVRCFAEPELQHCVRFSIPAEDGHFRRLENALTLALQPQVLCLDIDGCLIDTQKSFDGVVAAVVDHFRGGTVEKAEILALRAEGGFNDDNLVAQEILRRRNIMVPLENVLPVFRDFYIGTDSQPGLYRMEEPIIQSAFLAELRQKYHVALVTGRNREEGALALPVLGVEDVPMWTVDDVAAGKPDPEGILAAKRSQEADFAWMVGDNPDDIKAGKAAGTATIGVGDNAQALWDAGADMVIADINQLEELL